MSETAPAGRCGTRNRRREPGLVRGRSLHLLGRHFWRPRPPLRDGLRLQSLLADARAGRQPRARRRRRLARRAGRRAAPLRARDRRAEYRSATSRRTSWASASTTAPAIRAAGCGSVRWRWRSRSGTRWGSLFRFSEDGAIARVLDGFLVPNGMAFSPDGADVLHFRFTPVRANDLGLRLRPGRRRPLEPAGVRDDARSPWATRRRHGRCRRILLVSQRGRGMSRALRPQWAQMDRTIEVPTEKPSKVAFGGPSLDVMYVTSINHRLQNHDERGLAGSLFRLDAGIKGLLPNRFGPLEQSSTGQGT